MKTLVAECLVEDTFLKGIRHVAFSVISFTALACLFLQQASKINGVQIEIEPKQEELSVFQFKIKKTKRQTSDLEGLVHRPYQLRFKGRVVVYKNSLDGKCLQISAVKYEEAKPPSINELQNTGNTASTSGSTSKSNLEKGTTVSRQRFRGRSKANRDIVCSQTTSSTFSPSNNTSTMEPYSKAKTPVVPTIFQLTVIPFCNIKWGEQTHEINEQINEEETIEKLPKPFNPTDYKFYVALVDCTCSNMLWKGVFQAIPFDFCRNVAAKISLKDFEYSQIVPLEAKGGLKGTISSESDGAKECVIDFGELKEKKKEGFPLLKGFDYRAALGA